VVSVDIGHRPDRPAHPRPTYLTASSTDPEVVAQVAERAAGAGPAEAVQEFLKERDDFEVDRSREKFLFSFNPGGWLRKVG
jgi:cephalosporin hydroxylase